MRVDRLIDIIIGTMVNSLNFYEQITMLSQNSVHFSPFTVNCKFVDFFVCFCDVSSLLVV